MLIICENISPRLEYTLRFIFNELLGIEYRVLTSNNEESSAPGGCIYYSGERKGRGLTIVPSGLLNEKGLQAHTPPVSRLDNIPVLYPTQGEFPFDIFSAVFWMISRYEEYLPAKRDKFGRFPATSSLAFREGFLEIPVVNIWVRMLADSLSKRFTGFKSAGIPCSYIPTIDIDNPWAHRNKGIKSWLGGSLRQLSRGKISGLRERVAVLRSQKEDPYDSYDLIRSLHGKETLIFILAGSKGKYDNRISLRNENWRKLILTLDRDFQLGFHPSFRSNKSSAILKSEKQELEKLLNREVRISRQHFLILRMPSTYRSLLLAGIREDYSMGFPGRPGFRAGTSSSFRFYDIENERETKLRLFPFCLMDRTLKDYMSLQPADARKIIEKLIHQVKMYGGNFIPVWHNESLGSAAEWKNWPELYLEMHKLALETFKNPALP